jgi:hypothetical protein
VLATWTLAAVQAAVQLALAGDLRAHAVSEGLKAVAKSCE